MWGSTKCLTKAKNKKEKQENHEYHQAVQVGLSVWNIRSWVIQQDEQQIFGERNDGAPRQNQVLGNRAMYRRKGSQARIAIQDEPSIRE